ncbi:MAG: glycine cleavage system protein GcvH [Armatimonadetes bacterium]|nr:glycine cleavage system protein GcvH [Armatimonadota bacterium]
MYPQDLKYSQEHEWAKLEDGLVRVGITKFAADKLSDIVYVELPKVGAELRFMQPFGVVESVKAASDLCAPISGTVVAVNEPLTQAPEGISADPHGAAWMIVVKPSALGELDQLMDASAYSKFIGEG